MTDTPLILVNAPPLGALETEGLATLEAAGYRLWRNDTGVTLSRAELMRRIPEATAVLAGLEPYDAEVFAMAPKLKAVARFGVGFDAVDQAASEAAGVEVTITPGANAESVADVVFAMIAALSCGLLANHAEVMGGGWTKTKFPGLYGRTLGIVGYGRVGRVVARRAEGFGMPVLVHDPFVPEVPNARSLAQLIAEADVLTLHVPHMGTPILDADSIATMRDGAMVINVARGGLIDEAALAEALASGKLGGAGLDVFAQEPLGETPLRGAPNVILTPHIGGVSASATRMMADMCAENLLACLTGAPVPPDRVIVPRPS